MLRSIVEYYKNMKKQMQTRINEAHEPWDAAVAPSDTVTDYNRKSTTKQLAVEDESPTVMLILVAVCGGMVIILTLLLLTMICCRCQHLSESDDLESNDDALCGNCWLLGGVRRQQDKSRTAKRLIDVAIVNDRSSPDGIGEYTVLTRLY